MTLYIRVKTRRFGLTTKKSFSSKAKHRSGYSLDRGGSPASSNLDGDDDDDDYRRNPLAAGSQVFV